MQDLQCFAVLAPVIRLFALRIKSYGCNIAARSERALILAQNWATTHTASAR